MRTFLLTLLLMLAAAPAAGAPYFVANEGQWSGDFQFKCEVGSTIYYVTPKGLTVDFRSPPAGGGIKGGLAHPSSKNDFLRDPFLPPSVGVPAPPESDVKVRGHVIQIHYSFPPAGGGTKGGLLAHGQSKLPHYSNYFLSRDSTKWRSRVSHYERVVVPEVWSGIDVEYRADMLGVETIYHVKPGADPTLIQMEYLGLDAPLRIDAQGNLILTTSLGDVKEQAPFAFQQERGTQKRVDARFQVIDEIHVRYDLGAFDTGKELVVDPLIYSTFFANGSVDAVTDIEIDHEGNKVVSGNTNSANFPVTPGAYWEEAPGEFFNGFISKFSSDMDSLVFSTYFVTNGHTDILIAIDQTIWWLSQVAGNVEFPLTANALDTVRENSEIGIAHLNADGTQLLFGSYWGGNNQDQFVDLSEDENGIIYIPGTTYSTDLLTTENALNHTLTFGWNAHLLLINPADHSLLYSTYFPTSLDRANIYGGNITLLEPGKFWWSGSTNIGGIPVTPDAFQPEFEDTTGWQRYTSFFCLLNIFQESVVYCSYWGTAEGEWGDEIRKLIPLQGERLLICGNTRLPDYSFPPGGYQGEHLPDSNDFGAYIVDFALSGQILAGTFLAGHDMTYFSHFELLSDSTIVMTGTTIADDFPTTPDAQDSTFGGGSELSPYDVVIARLSSDLSSLLYGSFLGGSQADRVSESALHNDDLWLVGYTQSPDFPRTPDAMYPEAFAAEIGFITGFEFIPNGVVNAKVPSPNEFTLSAFPNPFNPTTTLTFSLPYRTNITLKIHDILGREAEHVDFGSLTAGQHEFIVNGEAWASGLYFATIETSKSSRTTKLLLLR